MYIIFVKDVRIMAINFSEILNEEEIYKQLKLENPNIKESSLKWELFHYIKDHHLAKIGTKKFKVNGKIYAYDYAKPLTKEIDSFLSKEYPIIKMVIWEKVQLNEWLNFLINTNIIYIEVEKEYVDYIFSALNDNYGDKYLILLNPNQDIISRYLRENLIIVKSLYSKSPLNRDNHKIKLEKLVVDIMANEINLDTRSIEDITKGIQDYDINIDKTLAYATRRRVKTKLLKTWREL